MLPGRIKQHLILALNSTAVFLPDTIRRGTAETLNSLCPNHVAVPDQPGSPDPMPGHDYTAPKFGLQNNRRAPKWIIFFWHNWL